MQHSIANWAALEDKLVQLARGHERLVDLIERQRQSIRRADPKSLAEVGLQIDAQVHELARIESDRRELCQRLAQSVGLSPMSAATAKLETFINRAGDRWAGRLKLAAAQLAGQMQRVRRAGRVNMSAAGRLSEFCGELMGQVARLSRDTGCYDARGRRALASQPIVASCFSAVG